MLVNINDPDTLIEGYLSFRQVICHTSPKRPRSEEYGEQTLQLVRVEIKEL